MAKRGSSAQSPDRRGRRRRWVLVLCAAVLLAVLPRHAQAEPPSFNVAPEPAWLSPSGPIDDAALAPDPSATGGREVLLYERQVSVGNGHQETFVRHVQRITNESGLQLASQVDIDFDPSFQSLTFHAIRVRRDGQVLDRLDRSAIRLVQREKNLDAQVYDGEVSAVMFLSDLRVGDLIEVAYTLAGADPTLQGRYADAFPMGADEPVRHLFARLLVPSSRHLQLSSRGPSSGGDDERRPSATSVPTSSTSGASPT